MEFITDRPWALAHFGEHLLQQGWWMFDVAAFNNRAPVEVHLSSDRNPLIVLRADGDGGDASGIRIFLSSRERFHAYLRVSPWPVRLQFTTLRLRKLRQEELLDLATSSVRRLLRSQRPLSKLTLAASQAINGEMVGLRTSSIQRASNASEIHLADASTPVPTRLVELGPVRALLGAKDELHHRALELVSKAFDRSPSARVIYSDLVEGGVVLPRPRWSPDYAPWFEVAPPPLFFRPGTTFEESDPTLWLREATTVAGAIGVERIPLPLVRRHSGFFPATPDIPPLFVESCPLVSVIIPTKFRMDLLEKCLQGLAHQTAYPALEVVVVDNGSVDKRLPDILSESAKILDLVQIVDKGDFNFSRLINRGVARSRGEVVLIFNDDVEPFDTSWLRRLVDSVTRPETGAVGARLLYPDRSIQHAGVVMGIGGVCGHLWRGLTEQEAARCPYVTLPSERMAVTGACLAIRRELFDFVGGLDEAAFPVSLNDIDLCLRIREKGYHNIYRGDAVLFHHESQSRGADAQSREKRSRLAAETAEFFSRWRSKLLDDPFASPMFDQRSEKARIHSAVLDENFASWQTIPVQG